MIQYLAVFFLERVWALPIIAQAQAVIHAQRRNMKMLW
jgi:hypothetical protein